MLSPSRILKFILILFIFTVINTCAPARRNPVYQKRKKNSYVDASMLGRNRYYFSSGYQKKLNKQFRK